MAEGLTGEPPEREDGPGGADPGRPDPRARPYDPAGTRPRHDPDSVLPAERRPLLTEVETVVDADVVEDPVDRHGPADPHLLPERAAPAAAGRVETSFTPRFQFILGGLIAVGLAALVAFGAILTGDETRTVTLGESGPQWSTWRPVGGAGTGPEQIADHVGRQYRLPNKQQLVAVTGGPMEVAGIPMTVVKREPAAQGGDIKMLEGDGVLYRFCGLGPNCAIKYGEPSVERGLLLRREALEMALYSFRYLGVDQTVVFMPPAKGQKQGDALFFQRSELDNALAQPLRATLEPRVPSVRKAADWPDAPLVLQLTNRTQFKFSLTQGNQENRAYLVLDPPEASP